jgi:hypothetical protein
MDNRKFDIVSEGDEALAMAVKIAWDNAPGGKASHYKIVNLKEDIRYYGNPTSHHYQDLKEDMDGIPTLILLWHDERNATSLPYPLDAESATKFIKGWLERVERGEQPDHDGDNGHGWRVFTEQWGHVAGHHYSILAVQPEWAMYGK